MAEKKITYPELLDKFGLELTKKIQAVQGDRLKPAIITDILDVYNAMAWMQQLMVLSYNLQVTNYNLSMERLTAVEKKNEELETRAAGYSERINALETKTKKLESGETIINLLQTNSELREFIKQHG